MNILEAIRELEDDIQRCVKCGLCRSVCPVFLELGWESSVARGKIALVEALSEGRLEVTSTLCERIECCLLCGKCVENCPSGVRVDHIIFKAREMSTRIRGFSLTKRIVLKIFLRNHFLFHLGLKIASVFQGIVLRAEGNSHVYKTRLNIGLDKRRAVLPLAKKSLQERWPDIISPEIPFRRVALFTGCIMNSVLPGIGEAAIKALLSHDVEVILPKDQSCCGIIALASGDEATFRTLAKRNLKIFSSLKVDGIITTCATCGYALKHLYTELLQYESKNMQDMAHGVSERTYDICEYFVNNLQVPAISRKERQITGNGITVTYHDPCHLNQTPGIRQAQRKFLGLIDTLHMQEMNEPDRCCGGGGSFGLSYYDVSLKILYRKMDDIAKTDADVVLTSCAGCHMQLVDGLAKRSLAVRVKHPVELYYEALGNTKSA